MMVEVATGAQNSVAFWNTKDFSQKRTVKPFPGVGHNLSSLSWSSSNAKLAVVPKWGEKVAVCDFQDDILTWSFLTHKESRSFTSGCLMTNTRYLLTGSDDSTVLLWDIKNKSTVRTFQGHRFPVMSVAHHSSDQLVASGGQDGRILLHSMSSSDPQQAVELTQDQPPSGKAITKLQFSQKEKALMGSATEDGVVCVWSTESQRLLAKFTDAHTGVASDLCFSPNNNMLMISVGMDAVIRCYDIQQRKTVTQVSAPAALGAVTMLQDGTTLLAGGADGKLYVYELRSFNKAPKAVISAHRSAITCIAEQAQTKPASGRSSSARGSSSSSSKRKGRSASAAKATPSGDLELRTSGRSAAAAATASEKPAVEELPSKLLPVSLAAATPYHTDSTDGALTSQTVDSGTSAIPPASHLSVQTPFLPHAGLGERGLAVPMQSLATPAPGSGSFEQPSGIFSPLDDHQLITPPLSAASKATATVPPTLRTLEEEEEEGGDPCSLQTPAHLSGRMGVFSPLERAQYPLITPGVLREPRGTVSLPPTAPPPAPPTTSAPIASAPQQSTSLSVNGDLHSRQSLQSNLQPFATAGISHASHRHPPPVTASSQAGDKPQRPLSPTHLLLSPPSASEEGTNTSTTSPSASTGVQTSASCSGIQMQYVESLIKDSQEDLWFAVHKDIRALSLDMFRQYFTIQEAFTTLNEKVERLTEQNHQLQELLHQYMPKH